MAERSHAINKLRHLPDMLRELLHACFELCATAAGIIWLEPFAALFVIPAAVAALLPALVTQPMLAERDLRVRSHAAGLTRFYLDAMLGMQAIRAHGAEQNIRRAHESLLSEWAHAALRLQQAVVGAESVQVTLMFACIASLFLLHPLQGAEIGRVLLLVYWALNLPVVGQEIAGLTRQYPYYRNLTLRLLEPLGAAEEGSAEAQQDLVTHRATAPALEFRGVSAEAAGNCILQEIDLKIEAGAHVALVGSSGAGKSSLVGILLGWLQPSAGEVLVDGVPLNIQQLRHSTAWVDPAVQIWNRSLFSNLSYGAEPDTAVVGRTIDIVMLRNVLENLPQGFQTRLGESGGLVSGGEGQRVRLGRAMARNDARLVILDEPFRGLDREKRRELLIRAREFWRDCTLLCITHDVSETQTFDQVLVVERGRMIEDGKPEELSKSGTSRYAQLLQAEERARTEIWNSSLWRRLSIHSGRIVEELPRTLPEKKREAEVA
jgi:ATP-binding cassette subfamily B protein